MTVEELGEVLNLKPSYIKTHWNRIVSSFVRRGVELEKVGRGGNAEYGVKFAWNEKVIWDKGEVE